MTSSPSPIPQTRKFNSSAAVAEFRHTTLLVWQYSASLFSSSFVLGPVVIQPLLIASATSFISSSEMSGGLNGITLFSIIVLPLPFLLFFLSFLLPTTFHPTNPLNLTISTPLLIRSIPTLRSSFPHCFVWFILFWSGDLHTVVVWFFG